uniref:(northern house mosquito) hypothetical protein n=1 Tax=Culex pipiens TaxID=7175 RepID=A0A8D7ZWQ1_CULPI
MSMSPEPSSPSFRTALASSPFHIASALRVTDPCRLLCCSPASRSPLSPLKYLLLQPIQHPLSKLLSFRQNCQISVNFTQFCLTFSFLHISITSHSSVKIPPSLCW